tara:strand:+ start:610 stop:837 length:228 start_codon:yes stop_codon:yes gene_type:complete
MANPNREKLSGLWANEFTNKEGETIRYMSGSSDGVKYSIWPNGYKENDNQPSHVLYRESVDESPKSPPKSNEMPF